MRPYLSAKFLRVGNHLINLELIQQLEVRKDDSAVITVPGPRKSYQRIEVPAPAGRQLWEFFSENLVVIDFETEAPAPSKEKGKDKAGSRTKESKAGSKVKSAEETEATSKGKAIPKKKPAAKPKSLQKHKSRTTPSETDAGV